MHFSLAQITNGDRECAYFLKCWGDYLRAVDDTIDDGKWTADNLFAVFAMGNKLYSGNYYRRHVQDLRMPVLTGTAMWQVSCEWERQPELWKRLWADYLRHSDVAMLSAVAMLQKGWEKSVEFIRAFLSGAYVDHADRHGIPQ